MADANRTTPQAVALFEALRAAPYSFGFFQALRRLECAHPERPRLGAATRPADDVVRLGQKVSLNFAPSTLADFRPGDGGTPPLLQVFFLGLFGPQGPLPLHLSDYARQRLANVHDPTLSAFADIFHHRMLSLFYRAWADARPTVSFDRPEEDRFSSYVGATCGFGMPSLRGRDAVPDIGKLYYAGLLAGQTHHAEGLIALLTDFFRLPVALEEFIGHWLTLPQTSLWRLGESPCTGALGRSTVVGARVFDRQYKFRIVFGPLNRDDFERLLPGGEYLPRLLALVRSYVGDELAWDLNLILKKDQVPRLTLGGSGQLGWSTWVLSDTPDKDAIDLRLDPLRYAAGAAPD
ncbi:MAG: type VI secretion system baseplate subunit TssG [Gammaproteobacteria bacterium]|nr:type VI secretion system baseplate subunit TssG [Gammaproteobacteria bacterium]